VYELAVLLMLVGWRHCKSEACCYYCDRHRYVTIWVHPQRPCHCTDVVLDLYRRHAAGQTTSQVPAYIS